MKRVQIFTIAFLALFLFKKRLVPAQTFQQDFKFVNWEEGNTANESILEEFPLTCITPFEAYLKAKDYLRDHFPRPDCFAFVENDERQFVMATGRVLIWGYEYRAKYNIEIQLAADTIYFRVRPLKLGHSDYAVFFREDGGVYPPGAELVSAFRRQAILETQAFANFMFGVDNDCDGTVDGDDTDTNG